MGWGQDPGLWGLGDVVQGSQQMRDIPQALRLDRGESASSLALAAQDEVGFFNSSWRK